MEELSESFETGNINSLWTNNIYENLKNLENMERIAREGCQSLLEYLSIPSYTRQIIIADTQYKNLKFMITELRLLMTDLTPVMDETAHKNFMDIVERLTTTIENREMFVDENYSAVKQSIVSSKTTPFFNETLDYISKMKRNIIKEIAHLLYIKPNENKKKWQ